MKIFEPANFGNCILQNRIIRSATFEGMCNQNGYPTEDYIKLYSHLAQNSVGGIITGFAYITKDGRAMQPGQAGIDHDSKIAYFKKVTREVHKYQAKIFMQIAHAGRQTNASVSGKVYGVSSSKSHYFNQRPQKLTEDQIYHLIGAFADSALRSQKSGFDGVQLHAAHGYLIHQFITPAINNRRDNFGVENRTKLGFRFLDLIIDRIRDKCGKDFPLLIKISAGDDFLKKFTKAQFINLIKFLDSKKVDGIEISFGTMDYALNIFRGNGIPTELILKHNPFYHITNRFYKKFWRTFVLPVLSSKFKKFTPMYNLPAAKLAKQHTKIPIICVGGFMSGTDIFQTLKSNSVDFVSLCRPFICEPDFVTKLKNDVDYISKCLYCNKCAVMCDSGNSTRCYSGTSN